MSSNFVSEEIFTNLSSITNDSNENTYLLYLGSLTAAFLQVTTSTNAPWSHIVSAIESLTRGRLRLVLYRMQREHLLPAAVSPHIGVVVRWQDTIYGSLYIQVMGTTPASPVISLSVAERLAQACGYLLQSLDNEMFLQARHGAIAIQQNVLEELTPQDTQVLLAMVKGLEEVAVG